MPLTALLLPAEQFHSQDGEKILVSYTSLSITPAWWLVVPSLL